MTCTEDKPVLCWQRGVQGAGHLWNIRSLWVQNYVPRFGFTRRVPHPIYLAASHVFFA